MKRPTPRLTKKFLVSYFNSHLNDELNYLAYLVEENCVDSTCYLKALYQLDHHGHKVESGDVVGEIIVDGVETSIGMLPAIVKRLEDSKGADNASARNQ